MPIKGLKMAKNAVVSNFFLVEEVLSFDLVGHM